MRELADSTRKLIPDSDAILREIPRLKETLNLNVERSHRVRALSLPRY